MFSWYPMATEAADLAEGKNLFEIVGRWKAREATCPTMHLKINVLRDGSDSPSRLLVNEASCSPVYETMGGARYLSADCTYQPLGLVVPTFAVANFELVERPGDRPLLSSRPRHFRDRLRRRCGKSDSVYHQWFGAPRPKARTADLDDATAAPFESGSWLLTPLTSTDPKLSGLAAAHQLTHAAFTSPRPWIDEGLAHFAQALYLEHVNGRAEALTYMGLHRSARWPRLKIRSQLPRQDPRMK